VGDAGFEPATPAV